MKRIWILVLAVLMLVVVPNMLLRAEAAEVVDSGTCGENLTWILDSDGLLTISGSGSMKDYSSSSSVPWYSQRESILSIVVEEGVTSIGNIAFESCVSLSSVTIPDSVISIGSGALVNCNSLTGIWVDDGNPNYSNDDHGVLFSKDKTELIRAPGGVSGAYSVPDSVTSIGDYAFHRCTSLSSITIPSSVTSIGNLAFESCVSLSSVTIPDSVTSIGDWVFSHCDSLSNVTIPEGVPSISDLAFNDCDSLISITIPESVTSINRYAFANCENLSIVHYAGTEAQRADISIGEENTDLTDATWHYECDGVVCMNPETPPTEPEVTEPEATEPETSGTCGENLTWTLDDAGTLTISGTGAMVDYYYDAPWYSRREEIVSVVVEDGVTTIGSFAFYNCDSLSSITLPETLTTIRGLAFAGCTSLSNITIPKNVAYIDEIAFMGCTNLEGIWVNEYNQHYTTDEHGVLFSRDGLTLITAPGGLEGSYSIPETVNTIGNYAFEECSKVTEIVVPEKVTHIGGMAFARCSALTSITLPQYVATMYENVFYGCSSLTSITIPDGITGFAGGVFYDCNNLTRISLPQSLTAIGTDVFFGCTGLLDVYYDGSEEQWNAITIFSGNENLLNANIHFAPKSSEDTTEPKPTEPGVTEPQETQPDVTKPEEDTSPENPFVDVVREDYYYDPVLWAVKENITTGMDETHFAPADICSRGQVVTFLWRANGSPEPETGYNPFRDVKMTDYFYEAVLWAVENGITSGVSADSFAPGAACTRGQVATFLWRSQGRPSSAAENIFTDIAAGAYYYDAVLWAVENGITNGMGEGIFAPDATCTRGQIVTFLYRAMK